jgi:hypothetical protein
MSILRIGNEIYRRVVEAESMTPDQAEVAAIEIARDIGALALFLKEQGLEKDYGNAMMIAERFEGMANAIAKQGLQKAASYLHTADDDDDAYWAEKDRPRSYEEEGPYSEVSQQKFDELIKESIGYVLDALSKRTAEVEQLKAYLQEKADKVDLERYIHTLQEFLKSVPELHSREALPAPTRSEILGKLQEAAYRLREDSKVFSGLNSLDDAFSWMNV